MTMTKQFVFLILMLFSLRNVGQNLLKNSGFEQYYQLPDLKYEFDEKYDDSLFICKYWHKVHNTTPDYYHYDANHKRYLIDQFNFDKNSYLTDSAYIGIVPFDLLGGSEPITGEFIEPLKAGKKYEISFSYRFAKDISYFFLDRIECIIGKNNLDFVYQRNRGITCYERIVTPEMKSNVIFEESLNNDGQWNTIKAIYTAKGDELYITLGFFFQNEELYKLVREYVSNNFVLNHNQELEARFFKKNRKHLSFIHRNSEYLPNIKDRLLEISFDNTTKNSKYIYEERISYYFIDNVIVKEMRIEN
jgi:hypothetical protein